MSPDSLRIGSLFTGTGALDLAVMDVYDAEVAWHSQYEPPDKNGKEDKYQYAAQILKRHWPDVPNLGDITKVDWQDVIDEHGPVDILTGGFPCQDVSSAGKRAGLTADSRSGLWAHFARAIRELNPRLVIIENVEGLLSADADRGLELNAEALDEEADAGRVLRALGAVLGDLATLGRDAEWVRVGADEVGAPHRRRRIIIRAWPAATNTPHVGHERSGSARRRGTGPANGDLPAPHSDRGGLQGHGELPAGRDPVRIGVRHDADGRHTAPADATSIRRGQGRPEPAGQLRRPDAAQRRHATPPDTDSLRRRTEVLELRPGQPDLDWGDFEPAIRRWEAVLGRPAPWPTDLRGRLTPVFSEWMMGFPDGWVTCTPAPEGMSLAALRNAMLRALGNGVVWQQAAAGTRVLHGRATEAVAEVAA